MTAPLLAVNNLKVSVFGDEGEASILDHVALTLAPGEILGVVGESGCGKSTLLRAILGLLPRASKILSGEVLFEGRDLLTLSPREIARTIRGRAMGFVPQDPYLSFNPVFTVGKQMREILRWSGSPDGGTGRRAQEARLAEVLREVQMPDIDTVLSRYPHQFSGGQRQRILIAGALAARPRVILADEPTTALDVTTQAQILELLRALAAEHGVAIVFVTHDFGAVAALCDRVVVMYAGQTVESGPTEDIIGAPKHPYTKALLACHPDRPGPLRGIDGQVSSPLDQPSGCRFHPRCDVAEPRCSRGRPPLVERDGRRVACVHWAA